MPLLMQENFEWIVFGAISGMICVRLTAYDVNRQYYMAVVIVAVFFPLLFLQAQQLQLSPSTCVHCGLW